MTFPKLECGGWHCCCMRVTLVRNHNNFDAKSRMFPIMQHSHFQLMYVHHILWVFGCHNHFCTIAIHSPRSANKLNKITCPWHSCFILFYFLSSTQSNCICNLCTLALCTFAFYCCCPWCWTSTLLWGHQDWWDFSFVNLYYVAV